MARGSYSLDSDIAAYRGRVFLASGKAIEAISTRTGRVLAHVRPRATVLDLRMIDSQLWLTSYGSHRLWLSRYTPELHLASTMELDRSASAPGGRLAAEPGGAAVLVTDGQRLLDVSTKTGHATTLNYPHPAGAVVADSWLSARPDEFAVVQRGGHIGSYVGVYRLLGRNAHLIASQNDKFGAPGQGLQDIAASPGRIYLIGSSGNALFASTLTLTRHSLHSVTTDQDLASSAQVVYQDHEVWIGSRDVLACADPRSGREITVTPLGSGNRVITALTTTDGRVLAIEARPDDRPALISAPQPAACR